MALYFKAFLEAAVASVLFDRLCASGSCCSREVAVRGTNHRIQVSDSDIAPPAPKAVNFSVGEGRGPIESSVGMIISNIRYYTATGALG